MITEATSPTATDTAADRQPSRLRGTMLHRGEQQIPVTSQKTEALLRLLPEADVSGEGVDSEFAGAEILCGVSLRNMIHISKQEIDVFDAEKAGAGKFGRGTYFAAGSLSGETFDLLRRPGNVVHDSELPAANVMIVDRKDIGALNTALREYVGRPVSRLKSSTDTAPSLTGDLNDTLVNGIHVDALMVFMDDERNAAEIIVLPHATDRIQIHNRVEF